MVGPSEEAVRVLHAEAKRHLDAVVSAMRDVDDKTSSLVRFNAVIVGVVTTGISLGLGSLETIPHLDKVLLLLALGLTAVAASTIAGIRSYLKPSVEVGVDPDRLVEVLALQAGEQDVRGDIVRAYRGGIKLNTLVLERTVVRFRWMLYSLMLGLVFLILSALGLLLLGAN